ncbi:MAG: MGMT family protein [Spirochaetes bacterium]|nr:MGMT family protein [Spirochaetota bacterium]
MSSNIFTHKVIDIIRNIPEGKILSYGIIAYMAGNPKGARRVSWILHSMSEKYNLPWWRVVNSKGIISIKTEEGIELQKKKLKKEGVRFTEDCQIDLNFYVWKKFK